MGCGNESGWGMLRVTYRATGPEIISPRLYTTATAYRRGKVGHYLREEKQTITGFRTSAPRRNSWTVSCFPPSLSRPSSIFRSLYELELVDCLSNVNVWRCGKKNERKGNKRCARGEKRYRERRQESNGDELASVAFISIFLIYSWNVQFSVEGEGTIKRHSVSILEGKDHAGIYAECVRGNTFKRMWHDPSWKI